MAICPASLNLIVLSMTTAAESGQGTRFLGRCCVVKDKYFLGTWLKRRFRLEASEAKHRADVIGVARGSRTNENEF